MKSRILKFLKDKGGKILLYFLVINSGMFVPFLYIDIKEFQLFLNKFFNFVENSGGNKKIINMTIGKLILCKIMILL